MFSSLQSRQIRTVFLFVILLATYGIGFAADDLQAISSREQAAKTLMRQKDYVGSREAYREILLDYPDAAIEAQSGVIQASILLDDDAAAESETAKLFSDYSEHPQIDKVVTDIANTYFRDRNYAKADQLCETIVDKWTNTSHAIWCRHTLVKSLFEQGDLSGAKQAADKLISDYSDRPDTAATIRYMADKYLRANHHAEAVELYQAVLENWAEANPAEGMRCQKGLVCSLIKQDKKADAAVAAGKLMSDYSGQPDIDKAVYGVANTYFRAGDYDEARQFCNAIVNKWPDSELVISCRQMIAKSLIQADRFAEAKAAADGLLLDYAKRPEVAATIRQMADQYRRYDYHAEAVELYQAAQKNWPDADVGVWCQQGVACSLIKQNNIADGTEASIKLISDYSDHPKISNAVSDVANQYFRADLNNEGRALCKLIQARWPESDAAVWSQQMLACSQIRQGDLAEGQLASDKLLSEYGSRSKISHAISQIANAYFWEGRHAESRQLCQMILEKWPDSDEAMWSRQTLLRMLIRDGDFAESEKAMTKLLTEHGSNPAIPKAIFAAGEEYYGWADRAMRNGDNDPARVNYQKALDIWQKNINDFQDSKYRCLAYYYSGITYRKLGENDRAIDYLYQVVENYPESIKALPAWSITASIYFSLYQSKEITKEQAEQAIQEIYEMIHEKWPTSQALSLLGKYLQKLQ